MNVNLPCNIFHKDFDYFHELVVHDEFVNIGCFQYVSGLIAGYSIGIPPLVHFGTPLQIERLVPPIVRGEKKICLAISEPYAGSDVGNIITTAVKSPCGKF